MSRSSLALTLSLALAAACSAPPVGDITGKVTVEDGDLGGVLVSIPGLAQSPQSDGTFTFKSVGTGSVHVTATKEGYEPAGADVEVESQRAADVTLSLKKRAVPNRPPVLGAFSVSPAVLGRGEHGRVLVNATDPDGDPLTYTFSADGGFTVTDGGEPGTGIVVAPDKADAQGTVRVVVSDGKGGEAKASLLVGTGRNLPPSFTSAVARPNVLKPAGTSTITVAAADPDGDALTYAWAAPEGWTVDGTGAEVTVTAPATHGADALVEVTADDGHGLSATTRLALTTTANALPVVSSLTAQPAQARPGGVIALKASAADADGEELTFTWTAPEGWTLTGTGAEVAVTAPAAYGQTAEIALEVADPFGGKAAARIVVGTAANGGPVVQSLVALPAQADPSGLVHVTAAAVDPDGDALTYAWTVPAGWTFEGPLDQPELVLRAPQQYGVSAMVKVDVSDGALVAHASTVVATRTNRAPAISSLRAEPTPVFRGGTVTVTAAAADPDGDALTYEWAAPQGWTLAGSGNEVTLTAPPDAGKSAIVSLTVSDGYGLSATAQAPVSTLANRVPVVESLSAVPLETAPRGAITLKVFASDADGDTLTYAWTIPTGWAMSGAGAQVVLTAPATYGASAEVSVQVSDGQGGKTTARTAVATRQNRPPAIASLVADPLPAGRGGTVNLTASASDPDNDALTYTWTAPAGWTLTPSGTTAKLVAPNSYGQSGVVKLTVTDGQGGTATAAVSVTTTSANRPPALDPITLGAQQPTGRQATFQADIRAVDADGDTLTYTWTVSPGWTFTGSGRTVSVTGPNAYARAGTLQVDVSDGVDVRTASIALATRANATPVLSGVATPGTAMLPGSSGAVTVTATDGDSDPLTYTYSLNNAAFAIAGSGASVVLRAPFQNAATAALTVTVDDGFGGSVTQTINVGTSSCPGTTMNCDGSLANGCEADLQADVNNCGTCANACGGSAPKCTSGTCSVLSCLAIKQGAPAATDGIYSIDPDGTGGNPAFQAYCDMTSDGGGWTLVAWTGTSSGTSPTGVPYPGLAYCSGLGCQRGSGVPAVSMNSLLALSKEFGVGQTPNTTLAKYQRLNTYTYAGKYTYASLASVRMNYGSNTCTGLLTGTFHNLVGTAVSEGKPVFLAQALGYATYSYAADTPNNYIWNVGVPTGMCSGDGLVPGTWMGTWTTTQYGPGQNNVAGAYSVWIR